jgi:HK97 family phage portal protein
MGIKNLFTNARTLWKQKGIGSLVDDQFIWRSLREIIAQSGTKITNPYAQCIWVYFCVNTISQNIARVPLKVMTGKKGDKDKEKEMDTGQLYDLFEQPNPYMSKRELIEATEVYMGLRGEAFWVLEGRTNVTQVPKEIWVWNPDRFREVKDQNGWLTGWEVENVGGKVIVPAEDVIQFKYFNPFNMHRGMSPLTASSLPVKSHYNASKYNEIFFEQGASLGGFVQVKEEMTDPAFNRMKNQLKERHQGLSNMHTIMLLEGGAEFKDTKISHKDMEFIKSKKVGREEIFAVYKVNAVVGGLFEDVKSYQGQEIAHKTFWKECLIPKMTNREEKIWQQFTMKIKGGREWVKFDLTGIEALQEDLESKMKIAKEMWMMGVPLDEINRKLNLGLENLPDADLGWIPANMKPSDGTIILPTESNKDNGKGKKILQISQEDKSGSGIIETAQHQLLWKSFVTKQMTLEKKLHQQLKKYIFNQRKKVLESFFNVYKSIGLKADIEQHKWKSKEVVKKSIVEILIDTEEELQKLVDILEPIYTIGMEEGAEMIAEELGLGGFEFNPLDPEFLEPATLKIKTIPKEILDTIKGQIDDAIRTGLAQGETVTEVAERIRGIYNHTMSRQMTIARTETSSSINQGRFSMMKKQGVEKHEWLTALDANVRGNDPKDQFDHTVLDGAIAEIGNKFKDKTGVIRNLKHPLDPQGYAGDVINCRCITVPVLEKKGV